MIRYVINFNNFFLSLFNISVKKFDFIKTKLNTSKTYLYMNKVIN